jgi:AraC family transcriptional activator of pyochelin receptor
MSLHFQQWHGLGGISCHSGRLPSGAARRQLEREAEHVPAGLKLGLVFRGTLEYLPEGRDSITLGESMLQLSIDPTASQAHHRFPAEQPLEFLTLRLPAESMHAVLGLDPEDLAQLIDPAAHGRNAVANCTADGELLILARQLLHSPELSAAALSLYRSGKALQLAAAVLDRLSGGASMAGSIRLHPRELRRLQQVRACLLADLRHPPGLDQLAHQIGSSVSQLTAGFRRHYGCSIYDFVREQRLHLARRLLEQGHTVSEVAWRCGYTDSHFSKAFQRRFGVVPSLLRS